MCVSHSVMSDSVWPHGLHQARILCPSPSPWACSNSCPLNQWCHPTISSSIIPFLLLPSTFPSIRVFQWVSSLHQVAQVLEPQPQHQSFQWVFTGLIWKCWFPLGLNGLLSMCTRNSQEFSPAPQFESINPLALSLLHGPGLTSVHDYWENHSFD